MEYLYDMAYRAVRDLLLDGLTTLREEEFDLEAKYDERKEDRAILLAHEHKCRGCLVKLCDMSSAIMKLEDAIRGARGEIRWFERQLGELDTLRVWQNGQYFDLTVFLMSNEMQEHLTLETVSDLSC
jgi:hypothetical protein